MPSQPRLCIAGLVTLVLIILLVGLVNNPYYSPPLPKSLSWAAGSLLSQSSLDTYDEAPDRTHAAFQDVDNEHEDFREFNHRTLRDLHVAWHWIIVGGIGPRWCSSQDIGSWTG